MRMPRNTTLLQALIAKYYIKNLVGVPRIELGFYEPESYVIPLYHTPILSIILHRVTDNFLLKISATPPRCRRTSGSQVVPHTTCALCRTRTCDPTRVKGVLYQLS